MDEHYQRLKSRAIKTVYQMLEFSKGQIDQNDILALGMFFGQLKNVEDVVKEYQRLANTYHEEYPHPEDLQATKDYLEQRIQELGM